MLETIALCLLVGTIITLNLILIFMGAIYLAYCLLFAKRPISDIIEKLLKSKLLVITFIISDIMLILLFFN